MKPCHPVLVVALRERHPAHSEAQKGRRPYKVKEDFYYIMANSQIASDLAKLKGIKSLRKADAATLCARKHSID